MSNLWYIRRARTITGPFPASVVKEKIRAGEVMPTDEIGVENDRWLNARAWDDLSTIPTQYSPGPENQPAFPEDAAKYPAPPPLPTARKAPNSDEWGWAKFLLAFFIWSCVAAYYKLPFWGMNQKQKPVFKSVQQQQQPTQSISPKPFSVLE